MTEGVYGGCHWCLRCRLRWSGADRGYSPRLPSPLVEISLGGEDLVKFLKQGLCLALLGAGLAAVPARVAARPSASRRRSGRRRPRRQRPRDEAEGTVYRQPRDRPPVERLVPRSGGRPAARAPGDSSAKDAGPRPTRTSTSTPARSAPQADQLIQPERAARPPYGWTVELSPRSYKGVPVFGADAPRATSTRPVDAHRRSTASPPPTSRRRRPTPASPSTEVERRRAPSPGAQPPPTRPASPATPPGIKASSKLVRLPRRAIARATPARTSWPTPSR